MKDTLRKVTFTLGAFEFNPDATEQERQEMEEQTRERVGYFHGWTEEIDNSGDIPVSQKKALIEDAETGKMCTVSPELIQFKKES